MRGWPPEAAARRVMVWERKPARGGGRLARAAVIWLALAAAARADAAGAGLAVALSAEGQHAEAAIEYRRLALTAPDAASSGGWFWAAAYAYGRTGQWSAAAALLDRAEDSDPALKTPVLLLRGDAALADRAYDAAAFYWRSAADDAADPDLRAYAARRAAEAELRAGRLEAARAALAQAPGDEAAALAALDRYRRGRDKRPLLGGTLGLVPGLGYAYAGEYANGARSLILNGLFLGAMVYSGLEDQWGAFAAISFFELTWYSGSIYGGIDAARRYNRRRLDRAVESIRGGLSLSPDLSRLPAVSLRVAF